jgi:hypothetical protein
MAGKQFADNFEEIARAMSPVAPDKVSVEMKPFIESLPKPLETTKDLLAIDDEQYDELPKPLPTTLSSEVAKKPAPSIPSGFCPMIISEFLIVVVSMLCEQLSKR